MTATVRSFIVGDPSTDDKTRAKNGEGRENRAGLGRCGREVPSIPLRWSSQ